MVVLVVWRRFRHAADDRLLRMMAIGLGAFLSAVGDLSRINVTPCRLSFALITLLLGIVHHIQFYYGAIH